MPSEPRSAAISCDVCGNGPCTSPLSPFCDRRAPTAATVSGFDCLDETGQFSNVNIDQVLTRIERHFHNEVADRGGDDVALRLVGKWLAGVEFREWFLLAEDRKTLMAEVERLEAAVYRLQGPM